MLLKNAFSIYSKMNLLLWRKPPPIWDLHHGSIPRRMDKCPFCNVEPEREIIASSSFSMAFFDGFPVSPGHVLIIPRRHVASFFELTLEERIDMLNLADDVKRIVDDKFHPDGYNIGVNIGEAAGQSIFHVHMHLIPRYSGDVPNPRGGVRGVIPARQNY